MIFVIFILNHEFLFSLNFNLLYEYYLDLKTYVNENLIILMTGYLIFSIVWITFIGLGSPVILLATFMFGYVGAFLSIFSFTIGSTFSYLFAKNFNHFIKNSIVNLKITNNSFFLFVIFRFIPGIPLIIKNFSGIFFNVSNIQFIKATVIAEVPQIILVTFIIQRLIESSELLIYNFDISVLSEKLIIPIFLMLIFVIFIFILKVKFHKFFIKN